MKRLTLCLAVGVLSLSAIGCDSSVSEGPVPFKATDTKQFDEMKANMMKNVLKGSAKKGGPAKSAAPAEAEKKAEVSTP